MNLEATQNIFIDIIGFIEFLTNAWLHDDSQVYGTTYQWVRKTMKPYKSMRSCVSQFISLWGRVYVNQLTSL